MITSVRTWKPTAVPRFLARAVGATRSTGEKQESKQGKGFFHSYEQMMETQAILILGLQNKRW